MAFYLTLPSNVAGEGNLIGNYLTTLNKPIVLEGEWEVGICDITYVNSIPNVPKGKVIKTDGGQKILERIYDMASYPSIKSLIIDIKNNFLLTYNKKHSTFILKKGEELYFVGRDFIALLGCFGQPDAKKM